MGQSETERRVLDIAQRLEHEAAELEKAAEYRGES
jgi:hypothetical protein